MTTTYSVYVEVGTYSWSVTGNDTDHDVAAAYGLADPLTISLGWPQSDAQPTVQPDPMEATLAIIAPDSTTYPLLSIGDPVAIEFYSQGGFAGNGQTFYGRVATMQANPHDLGVMYQLGCVDYNVDIAQNNPVGLIAYPSEFLQTRVLRLFQETNTPQPGGIPAGSMSVTARTAGAVDPLDYLLHLLSEWYVSAAVDEFGVALVAGGGGVDIPDRTRIPIVVPNITNRRLDPTTPYRLESTSNGRHVAWAPPGRLANVAGLQTITATAANSSPATGSPIVDAGSVDFQATFSKVKGPDSISKAVVVSDNGLVSGIDTGGFFFTVSYPTNPPTTNLQIQVDCELVAPGDISFLQQAYARSQRWGRPDPVTDWAAPTVTWLPWNLAVNWVMPKLGDVFTVARVAAAKNPTGREWITGVVTGLTLTVAGGRPTVTVQLGSLLLYEPANVAGQLGASLGVCRFDSPILGTTTFAQLSTRDTFRDYGIVRGS